MHVDKVKEKFEVKESPNGITKKIFTRLVFGTIFAEGRL
jgi:hypothetical protein